MPLALASLRTTATGDLTVYSESAGTWVTLDLQAGTLATVAASEAFSTGDPTSEFAWDDGAALLHDHNFDHVLASDTSTSLTFYENRSGLWGDRYEAVAFTKGGNTFVAMSATGDDGLALYRHESDGSFTRTTHKSDSSATATSNVTAISALVVGFESLVLAASSTDDGVSLYRATQSGNLLFKDTLSASEFLPVNAVTDIEITTIAGRHFAVIAASGTSSLTVLEITIGDYSLTGIDQVIDDTGTRFQNIQAMDVFQHQDRTFVLAAGADDGLSLFTLTGSGRLVHLESIADTLDAGLGNISEISVQFVGGDVQVFVTSESEAGVTQLSLDMSDVGLEITAENGVAFGGAGDDVIYDSAGADLLTGSGGADTFVFIADDETDTINDFQLGIDRLDLSHLGFLRDISQLTIQDRSYGARLTFGDHVIELRTLDGSRIEEDDLSNLDILNASHVSLEYLNDFDDSELHGTELDDVIEGTSASQIIHGYLGDDIILGQAGADDMRGGGGIDAADYQDAQIGLEASLADPSSNTGDAAGDTYDSIESLLGTPYEDILRGDANDNEIRGRGGNDIIEGGDGDDSLQGNDGNDRLDGGLGDDALFGGNGNDALLGREGNDVIRGAGGNDNIAAHAGDDIVYGGDGDDMIGGSFGNDILYGEAGNDIIGSGAQDDFIDAGTGNDVASGGWGSDYVYGGEGNDVLAGSYGADFVYGGAGDDSLGGGTLTDHLYGEDGADLIGAGDGDDFAWGGKGADFLGGGAGNDHLYGDNGSDTLNGGDGNDVLTGGFNDDIFVFNSFNAGETDIITDFKTDVDHIRMKFVAGRFDGLDISNVVIDGQGYARIEYSGHEILLEDVVASTLTQDDFIFLG